MTVANESSRKTFTGDGVTTSFGTSPVVFFETSNLVVSVVTTATGAATTLTENTHYTVSGGDGSTGTVNLAGGSAPYGAPSAAQTLVIVRNLPLTQSADPDNGDSSDAEVIEEAADRLTMMAQQLQRQIDGAFRLADTDVSGADATIPTPAASRLIGWNSAGTALENYAAADIDQVLVSSFVETLFDDADAATARATLGAAATASANTFTADQTIKGTTDSTAVGPTLELYRSRADGAAGADSDTIGAVLFTGNDDAGTPAKSDYARIAGSIVDSGAGSEDGQILFHTATNGTLAQRARITTGLVMGNPTGGDKGVGTINLTAAPYLNGYSIGGVAQVVADTASTAALGGVVTGTTAIPWDDTIPQITEGDQYLTATITPKNASSTLLIFAAAHCSHSAANQMTAALFKDAGADAIAVSSAYLSSTTGSHALHLAHRIAAGAASAQTFTVRVGSTTGATTTVNGHAGGRKFGGSGGSYLFIIEVLP